MQARQDFSMMRQTSFARSTRGMGEGYLMQKRPMGTTGIEVSALGLGVMRMPTIEGQTYEDGTGVMDVEKSIAMIRRAIDNGVNYFDTAYNYHCGNSEVVLGQALKDGYREKVYIASKSPAWLYKEESDFDHYLDLQMKRLDLDYLDFYLIHSLNGGSWRRTQKINALESLLQAKADGRVGHIGFSFHDDFDLFEEILDAAPWDFCQIQLNYRDTEFQAGLKGMRAAAERGMGVVVMEPLRGGLLADPPERVKEVFDASGIDRSYAEWGFDYLWNIPEVSLVLSGMRSIEMIDENCTYADRSHIGMLTPYENEVIAKAQAALASYNTVPCTGCNYCVEYCPNKIVIPYNFTALNLKEIESMDAAKNFYQNEISGYGRDASYCDACGTCEEHCPQHIRISEIMPSIDAELGA